MLQYTSLSLLPIKQPLTPTLLRFHLQNPAKPPVLTMESQSEGAPAPVSGLAQV